MALRTLQPQPVFNLDRPRRRPAGLAPAPVLAVGGRAETRIGPVKGGKGGFLKDVDMATLGNLCVDIVLNVPRLPPAKREERKAYMEQLAASPPDKKFWEAGGNCNLAIAAARLGLHVFTLGHVGNEVYGHFLLDVLQNESISMAIDEAEDEWGQHEMKKVIPTSGNLRNVIPANLAYFHMEFGLDRGFAHVIDDDANFPSSFGLNVIRGMLHLPEEDMPQRQQQEPIEKQKQAVASFAKEWEPFDWTKILIKQKEPAWWLHGDMTW